MLIVLKPKTTAEIRRDYPNTWVLLSDLKRDEDGNLLSAIVLEASNDQNEIYNRAKNLTMRDLTYWQTSRDAPS